MAISQRRALRGILSWAGERLRTNEKEQDHEALLTHSAVYPRRAVVVIAIIAPFVGAFLPAVQGAREQSPSRQCQNNLEKTWRSPPSNITPIMGSYPIGAGFA